MPLGTRQIINIPPGVNKEDNDFTSMIYTDADKMRFYQYLPQKIGGWLKSTPTNYQVLDGVPRTMYSYISDSNVEHILIGTDTRLYTYQQGGLYNITPLVTATTAIANSLSTNYAAALGTNPIATTNGSPVLTVTYSPILTAILRPGDIIKISGVIADIGGIPLASINGTHAISNITATAFDIVVLSTATSTATGATGCTLTTKVITVAQLAHGFRDGDRVKITAAVAFGGLVAGDINIENVIRRIDANTYAYYSPITANFATSSASGGGGAATLVQGQILAGICGLPSGSGSGYGGGTYGTGVYGVGKPFTAGFFRPRIWSIDRYGDTAVLTPGDQGGVYQWSNNINVAPVLITNAPAAVNYLFVAQVENQIVTFGAGGVSNRVYTSDSSNPTGWTKDATTLVFDRHIEGAGRLIAYAYVKGQYLLFTEADVYLMYFVDKPSIWVITLLTDTDGLIGPNAVANIPDAVVWMGQNDFYIYNGSVVSQVPNNTLLHWMIDKMNWPQSYVSFTRTVAEFDEIWFFFPGGSSAQPNTYIIWNYVEGHFTNGTLTRTAAERPNNPAREQYLAVGSCDGSIATALYRHEVTFADNNAAMTGSLTTNYALIDEGDYVQQISGIFPSSYILPIGAPDTTTVLYSLTVNTKDYDGQLNPRVFGSYNVLSTTTQINTRISGRQRQYIYNFSNTVGFRIQKTYEMKKPFTVR